MSESKPITIEHAVARDDLAFGLVCARGLKTQASPDALAAELSRWIEARRQPLDDESDARRKAARDILRNGVYKPTGRGKPASEYLLRAAQGDDFPRINGPVDANNVVSLRYMVPISVCDLDLAGSARFSLRLGREGERYVFNATGQEIKVEGLLCLHDADGPCANAVKDSQRTKTDDATTRTLSLVWGCQALGDHTDRVATWYRSLLERVGASTS